MSILQPSQAQTPQRFFVTGGAGFIGSHLCHSLLQNGHEVLTIDNLDPYYDVSLKRRNLEWLHATAKEQGRPGSFVSLELDLTEDWSENAKYLAFVKSGLNGVFHLAAKAGIRTSMQDPAGYFRHNVEATRRVLEEALQRYPNVPLVVASSSSVYGTCKTVPFRESDAKGQTLNPYACSKWLVERMCESFTQATPLRIATLRYFTVYGPRQRPEMAITKFIRKVLQEEPIEMYGEGKLIRDFTYVSDIVKGTIDSHRWLASQPERTYDCFNLGAGRPITVSDLIDSIERITGKKANRVPLPRPPEDMEQTSSDCGHAREKFGFQPRVQLDEGLRNALEWLERA